MTTAEPASSSSPRGVAPKPLQKTDDDSNGFDEEAAAALDEIAADLLAPRGVTEPQYVADQDSEYYDEEGAAALAEAAV